MVVPGRAPSPLVLLNARITPAVLELGSMGASGARAGPAGMAQEGSVVA